MNPLPPPLRLPWRNLPRPNLPLRLLARPTLRCMSYLLPGAPLPAALQRPYAGRGGAALSLCLARPGDAPRTKHPCCPAASLQPHNSDAVDDEGDRAGVDASSQRPDTNGEAGDKGEEEEDELGDGDAEPPVSVAAEQEGEGADEDVSQAPLRTARHPVALPIGTGL